MSLLATEVICPTCRGNGRVEMLEHCLACQGCGEVISARVVSQKFEKIIEYLENRKKSVRLQEKRATNEYHEGLHCGEYSAYADALGLIKTVIE